MVFDPQNFLSTVGCSHPGGVTKEKTETYLSEIDRQPGLKKWRFRQIIDSVHMVVADVCKHP